MCSGTVWAFTREQGVCVEGVVCEICVAKDGESRSSKTGDAAVRWFLLFLLLLLLLLRLLRVRFVGFGNHKAPAVFLVLDAGRCGNVMVCWNMRNARYEVYLSERILSRFCPWMSVTRRYCCCRRQLPPRWFKVLRRVRIRLLSMDRSILAVDRRV